MIAFLSRLHRHSTRLDSGTTDSLLPRPSLATSSRGARDQRKALLTALPCHVTVTPLPRVLPPPPAAVAITLPAACSQRAATGRGRTTEPDRMLSREKGEPNRIPETLRHSRLDRRIETGGNRWGRAGASERCHGGRSGGHVPRRPALSVPVTCPQRPRSQRWRRDPPATEVVATAAAAGFRPRPCSGCEKRGGARSDRTQFTHAKPETGAPTW